MCNDVVTSGHGRDRIIRIFFEIAELTLFGALQVVDISFDTGSLVVADLIALDMNVPRVAHFYTGPAIAVEAIAVDKGTRAFHS